MKFSSFIFLIMCNSIQLFAQDNNDLIISNSLNNPGDIILEVSPNFLSVEQNKLDFAGGFNVQSYIGKKFNVNGYLFIAHRHGYFNIGLVTVPIYMLLNNPGSNGIGSFEDLILNILLFATVFESPSLHIPVNGKSDISLNLSLLRLIWDSGYTNPGDVGTTIYPAFVAGLRYSHYMRRFVISPYSELSVQYKGFIPHINAGIHFGYYFPHK